MDKFLYILPAAIALFWVLRIFFLKNLNKVQLFIVAGMLMAVLTMFYREGFVLFVPYTNTIYFTVFLVIQIAAITVWSIISVRKYNTRLAEVYDTGSEASSDDISQVLIFMIITVVVFPIWMLLPDSVTSSALIAIIFAAFLSILQFMIGYHTYYMKDTSSIAAELANVEESTGEAARTSRDGINEDDALISKILEEKFYLDPMISLVSMAERLGTNRTYLSNSIHSCRGQNFSEFINRLRVNHFMDLVRSEPGVNVKEAATRSGYSNLQSFYRNLPQAWSLS